LDQDNGDDACHLLVQETCKDNQDNTRLKQSTQPGKVNVWGGVADPLPVLLFDSFLCIKHRVGCSLNCSPQTEWTILRQYVHTIATFDFPDNLEVYLNEAFFCQSFQDDKGCCTLNAASLDLTDDVHDAIGDAEVAEQLEAYQQSLNICVGKPVFDRQLAAIPSLVALKHVMNVTPGMANHRRPIKYTELPEEMIVGHLKFQLRGVVLGNNHHFISLVFVENMWLWYDGISNYGQPGPQLMVFSRYDSGGQTSSYSCSLMYYEVTPLSDEGATLISKSEGVLNQNYNSLGSVVDDNAVGADDSSNSSFEEVKTIQRKDGALDQKHRQLFSN
jgi:hypothetical protein